MEVLFIKYYYLFILKNIYYYYILYLIDKILKIEFKIYFWRLKLNKM